MEFFHNPEFFVDIAGVLAEALELLDGYLFPLGVQGEVDSAWRMTYSAW